MFKVQKNPSPLNLHCISTRFQLVRYDCSSDHYKNCLLFNLLVNSTLRLKVVFTSSLFGYYGLSFSIFVMILFSL